MSNIKNQINLFFITIFIVILYLSYFIYIQIQQLELTVNFLDIGQGDSILIKTASRYHILIDGGPDNSLIYKLGKYLPFYDRTIDLMVLTHPDGDHLIGLIEVLRRYKVKHVLLTAIFDDRASYKIFFDEIKKQNTSIILGGSAAKILIDHQTSLDILYPQRVIANQEFSSQNDTSVILKLTHKEISFLFTGDASIKVEDLLLSQNIDLKSKVLKVGHHGSKTSSGLEFIKKVSPDIAIIQVGQNRFGHPAPAVITRFTSLGIPVLTNLDYGDIVVGAFGQLISPALKKD